MRTQILTGIMSMIMVVLFGTINTEVLANKPFMQSQDTVRVVIQDTTMSAEFPITLPIRLSGNYDAAITSFDLQLSYDPSIINVDSIRNEVTILDGFEVTVSEDTQGIIEVSGTSGSGTTEEGLFLLLDISGISAGVSEISIDSLVLNQGDPAAETSGGTVTVGEPNNAKVDLWLMRISGFPDSTSQASTIQFFFATANIGVEEVPPYQITVYFSKDDSLSDDDVIAYDRISTRGIRAGGSRGLQLPIFVPRELEDGDYYLAVELDREDLIEEIGEYENMAITDSTIYVGSDEVLLPDLSVGYGSFIFNPSAGNESVDFELIAKNTGPGSAENIPVSLFISEDAELSAEDPVFYTNTYDLLESGASDTTEVQVNIPPEYTGTYQLFLVIDPNDDIAETNESNNINAIYSFTVSNENEGGIPDTFTLSQNYPNPFNPVTSIQFQLPEAASVDFRVYDMLGREVHASTGRRFSAGTHTLEFDASALSSGIYIYRLGYGNNVLTRKMTLLK